MNYSKSRKRLYKDVSETLLPLSNKERLLKRLPALVERETISKRTRDTLTAKKARDFQLGNLQNMTSAITQQEQATMQRNASEHPANQQAAMLAGLLRAQGQTLWEITNRLNAMGYRTRRGTAFHATTVQRLLSTRLYGQLAKPQQG